jgi:hypothetical protein
MVIQTEKYSLVDCNYIGDYKDITSQHRDLNHTLQFLHQIESDLPSMAPSQ